MLKISVNNSTILNFICNCILLPISRSINIRLPFSSVIVSSLEKEGDIVHKYIGGAFQFGHCQEGWGGRTTEGRCAHWDVWWSSVCFWPLSGVGVYCAVLSKHSTHWWDSSLVSNDKKVNQYHLFIDFWLIARLVLIFLSYIIIYLIRLGISVHRIDTNELDKFKCYYKRFEQLCSPALNFISHFYQNNRVSFENELSYLVCASFADWRAVLFPPNTEQVNIDFCSSHLHHPSENFWHYPTLNNLNETPPYAL